MYANWIIMLWISTEGCLQYARQSHVARVTVTGERGSKLWSLNWDFCTHFQPPKIFLGSCVCKKFKMRDKCAWNACNRLGRALTLGVRISWPERSVLVHETTWLYAHWKNVLCSVETWTCGDRNYISPLIANEWIFSMPLVSYVRCLHILILFERNLWFPHESQLSLIVHNSVGAQFPCYKVWILVIVFVWYCKPYVFRYQGFKSLLNKFACWNSDGVAKEISRQLT